jgi:hypothetical protein
MSIRVIPMMVMKIQAAASKPVDVIFLFSSETFEITSLVVSFVKVFCTESE